MTKKRILMKPPHPGKFIREELWELVLSMDSAAEVLGVSPGTLLDQACHDTMRQRAEEIDVKKFTPRFPVDLPVKGRPR